MQTCPYLEVFGRSGRRRSNLKVSKPSDWYRPRNVWTNNSDSVFPRLLWARLRVFKGLKALLPGLPWYSKPSSMSSSGVAPSSCSSSIVSSMIFGLYALDSTRTSLTTDRMAPRNARKGSDDSSMLIAGEYARKGLSSSLTRRHTIQ